MQCPGNALQSGYVGYVVTPRQNFAEIQKARSSSCSPASVVCLSVDDVSGFVSVLKENSGKYHHHHHLIPRIK